MLRCPSTLVSFDWIGVRHGVEDGVQIRWLVPGCTLFEELIDGVKRADLLSHGCRDELVERHAVGAR